MAAIYLLLLLCLRVQADAHVGTGDIQIIDSELEGTGQEALDSDEQHEVDSHSAKQGHCSYTFTVPTSDQPYQPQGGLDRVQKEVDSLNDWKYQVSSAVSRMEERIDQVAKWTDGLDNKVIYSDRVHTCNLYLIANR